MSSENYLLRFDPGYYVKNDVILNYVIHRPEKIVPHKRYPLILFFHASAERGRDNNRQLMGGISIFVRKQNFKNRPCYILAPQCPPKARWVNTDWRKLQHTMEKTPTEIMAMVLDLMEDILAHEPINQNQVYVTGYSMGGFGVWDATVRRPHLFAAAVPVCGGGDEKQITKILHLPVWAFHGSEDDVISVWRSRNMIAAMKLNGGSPLYTEYQGIGHGSWILAYRKPELYDWLFKQKRKTRY